MGIFKNLENMKKNMCRNGKTKKGEIITGVELKAIYNNHNIEVLR